MNGAGEYDVLAHKDFLASDTEAVSQCPRPDFSESCVCRIRFVTSRPVANFARELAVDYFSRRK